MIYKLILIFREPIDNEPLFIATITLDNANAEVINLVNHSPILILGSLDNATMESIVGNVNQCGYSVSECKINKLVIIENERKCKNKSKRKK